MRNEPKIELSALRQIGWDHWDPIGIRQFDADWPTEAPDEYDSYLLRVVSVLRGGQSEAEASAYLNHVASEDMGLRQRTALENEAAVTTVRAIATYLRTFPDGPLGVD